MTNLAKVNRVLEIFWWAMTAATLILVIVMCTIDGWDKWGLYFLIPVLTAIMALVRRFMSKRLNKSQAIKDEANKKKK